MKKQNMRNLFLCGVFFLMTYGFSHQLMVQTPDVRINLISMTCDIYGCQIHEGEPERNSIAIDFSSKQGATPYTVQLSQTISPASGLTLTPSLDGAELTYSRSSIDEQYQTVQGNQPGNYTVTTTATILETGQSKSRSITYNVLPFGYAQHGRELMR